jgi:hypothetical protein
MYPHSRSINIKTSHSSPRASNITNINTQLCKQAILLPCTQALDSSLVLIFQLLHLLHHSLITTLFLIFDLYIAAAMTPNNQELGVLVSKHLCRGRAPSSPVEYVKDVFGIPGAVGQGSVGGSGCGRVLGAEGVMAALREAERMLDLRGLLRECQDVGEVNAIVGRGQGVDAFAGGNSGRGVVVGGCGKEGLDFGDGLVGFFDKEPRRG